MDTLLAQNTQTVDTTRKGQDVLRRVALILPTLLADPPLDSGRVEIRVFCQNNRVFCRYANSLTCCTLRMGNNKAVTFWHNSIDYHVATKKEIPANLAGSGISSGWHSVKSMPRAFCAELEPFRLPVYIILFLFCGGQTIYQILRKRHTFKPEGF
jgi:hypothetical protein